VVVMKFKIGVFGSASGDHPAGLITKARALGKVLGERECTVITGACGGLPYEVAQTAASSRADVWGVSPAVDREEHMRIYPEQNMTMYKKLFSFQSGSQYTGTPCARNTAM